MMKRLYLGLLAVAAIAALTAVGSLALFTSTLTEDTHSFAAGEVNLQLSANRIINITDLAPGDVDQTQTYTVKYTGVGLDGWVGMEVVPDNTDGLLTCDGNAFSLTVTDDNGTAYYPPGDPAIASTVLGRYVVTDVAGSVNPWQPGDEKTFTITYGLPIGTGNACQGKSATLKLSIMAVQSKNNSNASGPLSWDWDQDGTP